jgi:hypothetical protein
MPEYDEFTVTAHELASWLRTQPLDALVVVNPAGKTGPFGVTGHAPAGELDDGRRAVVLTP